MLLKYKKLLKRGSALLFISGGGWMWYQVHKMRDTLNRIVNTDVLDAQRSQAQYVYLTDPPFIGRNLEDELYSFDKPSVSQWWNSLRNSVAWRLLSAAKTSNRIDRLHAVRLLAKIKNLNDSDYKQLAQVCDARTAVGLARTRNVDLRFFLKPPYSHISHTRQELINEMHQLIEALNLETDHLCLKYFLSKSFPEFQDRHKLFDHDQTSLEPPTSFINRQDLLPVCVQTLTHHSSVMNSGRDIVKHGGLRLLMSVRRHCASEKEIQVLLANLIANISVNQDLLENLFQTGWIGVLAEWAQDPDIQISVPAAKALANLDADDDMHNLYVNGMFPLHPLWRTLEPVKVDVVFVHGLLGGVLVTWRQRDRSSRAEKLTKPQEIPVPDDFKMSDEKTQEYMLEVSAQKHEEWEEIGQDFETVMPDSPENTNVQATGPFILQRNQKSSLQSDKYTRCWPMDWLPKDCSNLRILGVNYDTKLTLWSPMCPIEATKRSLAERSEDMLRMLQQAGVGCRPVVWVAHSMGGLLVKNTLVKAWKSDDPELKNMCHSTKGIVFYSVPHKGTPMANLTSATELVVSPTVEVQELRENPGVGEYFEIPQDHLCICKPASRESFLYQKVLHLISKILASS
ncbi:protein SERAC1 isoform X2 [Anabrus simplex]|uniref:protein SERAC1 isoform X2 n=1 Tax=Anabrus simplex TaxID=316456 RepID=UPI0035A35389